MSPEIQTFIQSAYGVNTDRLSQVEIKRMTLDETEFAETFVKQKRCYDNSFHLCSVMQYRYVLGIVTGSLIPFEHAWCMTSDGRMIDPTQQLFFDDENIQHYSLLIIKPEELFDVADRTGRFAPMLHTVRRLDEYKHLFVDQSRFFKPVQEFRKAS